MVWLFGACALLARAVHVTRRMASDPALGPALIGVLQPRLVLPADFETRFDAHERALILAHEDAHRAGFHVPVNALVEFARCLNWFNPLAHIAAACARADQELAADAAVITAHPTERRVYAQALLKTQIAHGAPPLGCAWPSSSVARLKDRIAMLAQRPPGRGRRLAGVALIAIVAAGSGVAVWAAQPSRVTPEAVSPAERYYRVAEIFFAIDSAADEPAARELADDVVLQLQAGADFPAVAEQYSDAPSARNGGDLGYRTLDQFPPEVAAQLRSMQVNRVAGPIRTADGIYIIALLDRGDAPPEPVWTPSSEAPEGVLTELEAQRHDLFIDLAQSAAPCPGSPRSACKDGESIDIVFFGTTNTEMFWWPDRGMKVWEEAFAARKAANFGSQGTDPESLLWRMRNGELDGYRAKVVVLQAFCCIEAAILPDRQAELIANYEAILAEIRARQPEAKILIFADFPRGQLQRDAWRQAAAANAAAHAEIVDNETVFYVDIGERFFRPDGAHDQSMWSQDMSSRGIQAPAFEAWVEELEPWLDRFVR
jgi:hypothetical protein